MPTPSQRQLERHIRASAENSSCLVLTKHARQRMRQRRVSLPMLVETLQRGTLVRPPEPDMKHPGVLCRMERFVAGVNVAAVVYVEFPAPTLVVVTVIDLDGD